MNKQTKFSRAILAIAMMLAVALPSLARAYDFEVNGIYYDVLDETAKTVEVTYGYYNYYGSVTIPSTVTYKDATYFVISIGKFAFSGCSGLTSVTIPNSVTVIGYKAFSGCSGLTKVIIPKSVEYIASEAFTDCDNLDSVIITNPNTQYEYNSFPEHTKIIRLNQ